MDSRIRKTALAGGALLVAAGLTSCIRVEMDIVLDEGTASGEVVLAVSQELLDMAGGDVESVFEDTDLPEDATVEVYEEDGYVGQRYVFENAELAEFSGEDLSITYDEDTGRYEIDGVMAFGAQDDLAELPAELADTFDVSLSVTFPGEVVEHNGELDGRTVTWTPAMGESSEIHAVAEEGSGAPAWLWDALAALAVLLVVGLAAFLVFRRGARDARSEGAVAVPAGQGRDVGPDDVTQDLSVAAADAARPGARGPASAGSTRDLTDAADSAAQDVADGSADGGPSVTGAAAHDDGRTSDDERR